MRLSDLIGIETSANTTTATLRGKPVTLRLTSALTQARLEESVPRPRAPMVPDPNRGTLAPKVPDMTDPGYQQASETWAARLQVAEVAVALDLEVDGRTWDSLADGDERRDWATKAIDQLGSSLTRAEIGLLMGAIARAVVGHLPREALGN